MHESGQLVRPVLGFHLVVPSGVVDGGREPRPRGATSDRACWS